jgi:hypothetical protein
LRNFSRVIKRRRPLRSSVSKRLSKKKRERLSLNALLNLKQSQNPKALGATQALAVGHLLE